jgi:serine/threonine protein kinase
MANKVGRFEVLRKLGEGAQGKVYLARDPHLDRQVAIKTLLHASNNMDTLLKEARIVSKLQHKNIVALFDAGEHEAAAYLVYAFVEGQTLAQLLCDEVTLTPVQAAKIVCGILEGTSHAHQQGIVHLDLKPSNIMIAENGQPLIMDFGIARSITQDSVKNSQINGTPSYIAPEILAGKNATPSADLFSLGVILHELVTGKLVGDAQKTEHTKTDSISETSTASNQHIDEQLDGIILKATAKKPEDRFSTAEAMQIALQDYLSPAHSELKLIDTHGTLDFLLRRMRSKSDFPVLASTISEINRIVDDDSASANLLTQCILQDFALTNKLLKLVNTVTYGQFGGQINTISKAVVILGFESVRNVAMTLILLDFLQNKAQVSQLKDDVLASFFSGIVAVQFSAGLNIRDAEEAMICSMFRNLGKLLASFYFFEESQQVARLVEQGESEDSAAIQVLGISYNELGIGVAKSWSFPPRLIIGMRKVAGDKIAKPQGELDNLSVTVNLAHELCAIASHGHALDKAKALKQLVRRYEDAINTSEQQLRKTMENGMGELAARAKVVGIDLAHSLLMKRVKVWIGAKSEVVADKKPLEPDSLAGITQLGMEIESQSERVGEIPKITPEAMLTEGIQEITNTLVEDHKLNDIIQMVLETMYRAMGFNRTLFLVRDVKAHKMVARFGFGQDADAVLPKFRFSLDFTADVFHLAMSKGADLMIEDIAAENIVGKIPSWYRQAVSSQSFMLLPVVVNSKPVGIFYADMGQANTMLVSPKQLSLLRTLRNQAVLAIKQKS